jgi:hypothetical protein
VKQCDVYHEEGNDINLGNNPNGRVMSDYYVDTEYSKELPTPIVDSGEFEVYYKLYDRKEPGVVVDTARRRVVVTPVNRCGLDCGIKCPANTVCRWKNQVLDESQATLYPNDIECSCVQPIECLRPQHSAYAIQKVNEGYKMHWNQETVCYTEIGDLERTLCQDVAAPVMFYKEPESMYTCRVCNDSLVEGELGKINCVFMDYHDQVEKNCTILRSDRKVMVTSTQFNETVNLRAMDSAGNVCSMDIVVSHHIEDVSVHIKELIEFRNSMRDFVDGMNTIWSWIKTLLLAMFIIFVLWLFTDAGSLFFLVVCRKIETPMRPFYAIKADIEVERMMKRRGVGVRN